MISKTAPTLQCPNGWQAEMAAAIRDPAELLAILQLPDSLLEPAKAAAARFPLRVPHAFVQRMKTGDIHDPLLRQVLPLSMELEHHPDFRTDPVGDLYALATAGLIHKYHGRALLITTGACAIHCRYCFRRHFPYQEHLQAQNWPAIKAYLDTHPDITEIILSGGDPLSQSDKRLAELIDRLSNMPQLTTLRVHSRLPVVIPNRITPTLLHTLGNTRLRVVLVLHVNHPNEINPALADACRQLHEHHVHCLNQAVLLRSINDDVETLTLLSERLFDAGILPYYLHQLDPVDGAQHFHVSIERGLQLLSEVRSHLPGYLVPRYAQEIAGEKSKISLG